MIEFWSKLGKNKQKGCKISSALCSAFQNKTTIETNRLKTYNSLYSGVCFDFFVNSVNYSKNLHVDYESEMTHNDLRNNSLDN